MSQSINRNKKTTWSRLAISLIVKSVLDFYRGIIDIIIRINRTYLLQGGLPRSCSNIDRYNILMQMNRLLGLMGYDASTIG